MSLTSFSLSRDLKHCFLSVHMWVHKMFILHLIVCKSVYFSVTLSPAVFMLLRISSCVQSFTAQSAELTAAERGWTLQIYFTLWFMCESQIWSYHSFSSLQWGFCSTSDSRITDSPILFLDRLSSLRCSGFDLRAEVRAAKPSSVTPQSLNL